MYSRLGYMGSITAQKKEIPRLQNSSAKDLEGYFSRGLLKIWLRSSVP